jgi:Integrase core domain
MIILPISSQCLSPRHTPTQKVTFQTPSSFFGLLKAEIGTAVWESREAARADVFRFIEVEYNRTRLRKHPGRLFKTPWRSRDN